MSDRLEDLRRQRALVAEQLAWLDKEIAAAGGGSPPEPAKPTTPPVPVRPVATPKPAVAATAAPRSEAAASAAADAILADYRVEPDAMKSDIKKGCFLYFFAALTLVALVVAVFYFAFQHK